MKLGGENGRNCFYWNGQQNHCKWGTFELRLTGGEEAIIKGLRKEHSMQKEQQVKKARDVKELSVLEGQKEGRGVGRMVRREVLGHVQRLARSALCTVLLVMLGSFCFTLNPVELLKAFKQWIHLICFML